jgi:hypothetical protein
MNIGSIGLAEVLNACLFKVVIVTAEYLSGVDVSTINLINEHSSAYYSPN